MCAGSAQAYCRTHTLDPAQSSCPDQCPELGLALAWPSPHLEYAFNDKGFPGIADADLRRMIATSIGTWEGVHCGGKSVELHSVAADAPTSLTVGPEDQEPNENVIVHFTASEWEDQGLGSKAFAITAVWFNSKNGDILGADMMFNGGMDPFGECSDRGCLTSNPATDLRNVATHEFGHFLGLSHSNVDGSTMWCNADQGEVSKRSLATDDIEGLCDIYTPGKAFSELKSASRNSSCSFTPSAERSAPWAALLVPLALLWRRRRRR
jgi:MYXO-CTERM domain-containing protein